MDLLPDITTHLVDLRADLALAGSWYGQGEGDAAASYQPGSPPSKSNLSCALGGKHPLTTYAIGDRGARAGILVGSNASAVTQAP